MDFNTDLALERHEMALLKSSKNIKILKKEENEYKLTWIKILNNQGEKELGQPIGNYITLETKEFAHESELLSQKYNPFIKTLSELLPTVHSKVLIAGLGNENITPDALGPKTIRGIFATSHLTNSIKKQIGLENLTSVSAIALGVLGQTGIESASLLQSITNQIKPDYVILVDALAAKNVSHLGNTIQFSDTGLIPGSGIGNHRLAINQKFLNIPVFSIGVPTVINSAAIFENELQNEYSDFLFCPKDIDIMIHRASKFISFSLNCALQPYISPDILLSIV